MRNRSFATAIMVAAFCATACQKPTDTANTEPTKPTPGQSQSAAQTSTMPPVPAELQNDAYHYYGLSRKAPATYLVTIDKGSPQTGTETVTYKGMEGGKAKFSIERTGALEQLGSEDVALDDKGVTILATNPGKLEGNPIDMPAKLTPGTSWKTDYKVTLDQNGSTTVTEDHSTFKVVGTQKVTTKEGTFDAILVESEGKDSLNSQSFDLKTQSWYVKDRGPVKITVTTTMAGKSTSLLIEAVPGDPK